MKRTSLIAWTLVALGAGLAVGTLHERSEAQATAAAAPAPVGATLLKGLGDYEFRITTSVPEVQRWFDQGLMLTYGFNHDAAERSYLKGAELDPQCAMCWWGAALVLGPHVNARWIRPRTPRPGSACSAPSRLRRSTTERERAFIEALRARYAASPPENRRTLDEAYAESTRRARRGAPGRSRCAGLPRRGDDGPAALGLLRREPRSPRVTRARSCGRSKA